MKALVIGYGSIGKRHIQNLSKISQMKISVYTKRKMDNFLKKNDCNIFNSLPDALQESPDFAIICNETSYHIPTALKLAEKKIPFFIEKPLGDSKNGTKKLVKLIQKNKLITMVGCNFRFHPCIKEMKKLIDKNLIGKIIFVRSENGSYLPDWHANEDYSKNYASKKKLGGGVVLSCIHELDYLIWLFGKIKNTFSISGKFSNLKIDVEDISLNLLKFENNLIGELHLNFLQKPNSRYCKLVGFNGTIFSDFTKNKIDFYDNKKKKWITKFYQKNYNYNKMYVDELNYFIHCIKHNNETMNSVQKNLETLSLALTMKKY